MKNLYRISGVILLIFFIHACKKDEDIIIKDTDGNSYSPVVIGTQTWLTENLKTTKFNDGNVIPCLTDNMAWNDLKTQGYCWYDNSETTYKNMYGALYNWYAVNSGNLCPTGWHVPSMEEWNVLIEYLGGVDIAGGKLKEQGTTHWLNSNTGATNNSGFTGLPSGGRFQNGSFFYAKMECNWWSNTVLYSNEITFGSLVHLDFDHASALSGATNKNYGHSVRCIKD